MKSYLIIVTIILVSCADPDTIQCDNNPNPCQNGGTCIEGPWTSFKCDCPDGFCGDTCELERTYSLYGTYTGVYICLGDTINKDFVVEETDVCRVILSLNRGEFNAEYWKGGYPTAEPNFWIEAQRADYVPNNSGWGRLTTDSLFFWIWTGTPQDTCFYVGLSN